MKVRLGSIKANPFRHIDRYPFKADKIEALKKSITDTTFWDNIVARENEDGEIEIAYGHHRLRALEDLYSPGKQIDLIVRKLDDTRMAKIMANENMEEWGSQADVEQETIRAIVEGYADGRIKLGKVSTNGPRYYAPSFRVGADKKGKPYNVDMLVTFLGWGSFKVRSALQALGTIEEGTLDDSAFQGLSTEQSSVLTREVSRSMKQHRNDPEAGKKEARQIVRSVAPKMRERKIGTRDVKDEASKVRLSGQKKKPEMPDLPKFVRRLSVTVHNVFDPVSNLRQRLNELIKFKKHLTENDRNEILHALDTLIEDAMKLRDRLI